MIDSMQTKVSSQDSRKLDSLKVALAMRVLEPYKLDIQGAAQAFGYLYGTAQQSPEWPFHAFAYDSKAATWRRWEDGIGWQAEQTPLRFMTGVVDAMCALEAWRKHGVSTIAEQLAELEETGDDVDDSDLAKTLGQNLKEADDNWRKLRQRHLGTTVEKALKLAQATMTVTAWDSDPMVFGMPDGGATYITMNNPTNPTHQLDGEPTDYLTRKLGATPGPMTPDVRKFLDWFTDGDLIYENALQIWLAASLFPGNVGDKAHILVGDGGTGKSSILKAVGKALGDYSGSARANVFVSEKDCHPAELLPFINNRMVILPELPIGALRSDLLKTVTGGDSISVRGMRQNPRTETPNATLWFSANELPSIRMVDNALRRRLMIWPCNNQPDKVDRRLRDVLQQPDNLAAWVGWFMVGVRKYVRLTAQGLDMPIPERVQAATDEYLAEVDTIGLWRDACTVEGGDELSSTLYKSYRGWCDTTNRKPLGDRAFGLWMGRNYEKRRTTQGNTYPVTISV